MVQDIEPYIGRLDKIMHLDSIEIWGHRCKLHKNEATCYEAKTTGKSPKIF